jgi:hypothetical protein
VARLFTWPIRRILDPRFQGLAHQLAESHAQLNRQLEEARSEATERSFAVRERANAIEHRQLEQLNTLDEVRGLVRSDLDAGSQAGSIVGRSLAELQGSADRLDSRVKEVASAVGVGTANLRAVQRAYALRASAPLAAGAKVLQAGRDDELCSALATLGFLVTLTDAEAAPSHPNVSLDGSSPKSFDAVIVLTDDGEIGDAHLGVRPGGTFVLTARGDLASDGGRLKDWLAETLPGWRIVDLTRLGAAAGTWSPVEVGSPSSAEYAALVTARRPD